MKKSCLLAASVAAASAYSSSSSSYPSACVTYNLPRVSDSQKVGSDKDKKRTASGDKFAPKFDGLRFIETLVTAHR